jgi:mRNA interferase MazF
VPYPFTDLSGAKLRPALVLAEVSSEDVILCQITTKPYSSRVVVKLDPRENERSGLREISYARPEKLFTAHQSIIQSRIGQLSPMIVERVVESITALLRVGS